MDVQTSNQENKQVVVKFKRLHKDAVIPQYAREGDFCKDIVAVDVEYNADMDCFIYKTGFAVEIPQGYGILILPRSSNRKTDFIFPNSVGVIDSGYRGELNVTFKGRDKGNTNQPYQVGDRIAQMVLVPYSKFNFVEVDELSDSERGDQGHGSTGTAEVTPTSVESTAVDGIPANNIAKDEVDKKTAKFADVAKANKFK